MEMWLATGNKGKVSEFKMLFNQLGELKIFTQADLPSFTPRPEDGKTFLENARVKTRTLHAVKNKVWTLGEDSGLEVEGLNNLPGIHSARYAGPKASDSENVSKLIKMMLIRPMSNRNAKFVCSMVVYTPTGEEWVFEGSLKGVIAAKPAGILGFGYDSVFIPEGETKTLAELGPGYKAQRSHRAQAAHQFLKRLAESNKPPLTN